jgi:iron complex transport system permease protein
VRSAPGILVVLAVLVLAVLVSLSVGSRSVPLGEVWQALVDPGTGYEVTVVQSRIPRTMLGVLVGAALAVAGVVLQGLTRNPLADPGILGVNVGAGAAIVTATAFLGLGAGATSVWVAMPGAFAAVALVYWLGSGSRGSSPVRLVLAGAVVSAIIAAYIQALSLSLPDVFDTYRYWVVGSLAGRDPGTAVTILPFVAVGLVLAFALAPALDTLAMGDDTAISLGANTARTRLIGAVAVAVLSGAATAACGPIGFVGLAVPHIVRSFTGGGHPRLLAYSVVLGPVLVLVADIVGRVIVSPAELMVGVVTAFIGGPFLLAAVRRSGARG